MSPSGMGLHAKKAFAAIVAIKKVFPFLPEGHSMIEQLCFDRMRDVELALMHLGCSPELADRLLTCPTDFYEPVSIVRQKSRTVRRVYRVLDNDVRRVHRTIGRGLHKSLNALPECVQGFRRGRSAFTNAAMHCGRSALLVADLEDFFGSIDLHQVWELFQRLGASRQAALLVARLTTLGGKLVQGGRASPAIANLIGTRVDGAILEAFPGVTYSRYADDLALSGATVPSIEELSLVVERRGFRVRSGSAKLRARGHGQHVTGFFFEGSRPRAPRVLRRWFSRELRFLQRYGIYERLERGTGVPVSTEEVQRYIKQFSSLVASYREAEPEVYGRWRAIISA